MNNEIKRLNSDVCLCVALEVAMVSQVAGGELR